MIIALSDFLPLCSAVCCLRCSIQLLVLDFNYALSVPAARAFPKCDVLGLSWEFYVCVQGAFQNRTKQGATEMHRAYLGLIKIGSLLEHVRTVVSCCILL